MRTWDYALAALMTAWAAFLIVATPRVTVMSAVVGWAVWIMCAALFAMRVRARRNESHG